MVDHLSVCTPRAPSSMPVWLHRQLPVGAPGLEVCVRGIGVLVGRVPSPRRWPPLVDAMRLPSGVDPAAAGVAHTFSDAYRQCAVPARLAGGRHRWPDIERGQPVRGDGGFPLGGRSVGVVVASHHRIRFSA